ncbi:P-loop containing nucleoside triphosphate hydrolase protein [Trametes versicolor FP-101664 SS1]|uniref:P-loop containing nucleoside triphosphate hydrolase protein n=1 Tax=Trametes versicolor (strain FP-101664) TaxID=717944 RepID=UPI000462369F|nr:P-loop containing nucleoside triphosphate hydrolase protein [Trametes versicolor FP-101664 SS1]EIW62162.1 P-loop containing nucleoside triphosphate hydrolase protein [Trametes versicolor FP-101664 SS1]
MPRIRKKTSKRGTLNQRARIAKKVQETHRKQKRAARKAPPKKSKPKDPGIPNAFPFKDQILAEIAEQRRQATEEKQRRKDEKKAAKSNAADVSDASGDEGDGAFDGVLSLNASAQSAPRKGRVAEPVAEDDVEAEEEETPILVNPDLPDLKSVLDAADVMLEVLDARDPLAARSAHVEGLARESGKRVLLVLNKVDVCPREAVEAWATTLRKEHPTVLFRSASASLPAPAESVKGKAKERVDDAWGLDATLAVLQQWANEKKGDSPLTVAVVGVTNVGKSAVVNSLLRKAVLQTYKLTSTPPETPTTTTHPQEVMLELEGKSVRLIDTPGLSWHPSEDASEEEFVQARARDVLLRNRGHIERLKDPAHVMSGLVSRATREDLMLLYNLPIFTEGDANSFLAGVARAHRFMKKRGDPDLTAAARMVLRDWSNGKLARYTVPPSSSADASAPAETAFVEIYAKDEVVLSRLASRKELRKAGGLVKLRAGAIDTRKPTLDESYSTGSDSDADEEDGSDLDELDDDDVDEEDIDEEDDDEDDDEDEEEEAPSPRGKRKRSATKAAAPARPAKKVAFAAEPKGTKQARSAAGARGAAKAKASADSEDKPAKKPSALKKAAPAKPAVAKRVANSSTGSKKAAAAPAPAKDGEVEYDFKQFF